MKYLITFSMLLLMSTMTIAQRPKIFSDKVDPFDGSRTISTSSTKIAKNSQTGSVLMLRCFVQISEGDTSRFMLLSSPTDIGCCRTGSGYVNLLYQDDSSDKYVEEKGSAKCNSGCEEIFKVDSWDVLNNLKLIRFSGSKYYFDSEPYQKGIDMMLELIEETDGL